MLRGDVVVCAECHDRLTHQNPVARTSPAKAPQRPPATLDDPPAELSQLAASTFTSGDRRPPFSRSNNPIAPPTSQSRECPFCRQVVDSRASSCPHCSAEIGRLQDCVECPSCREMVLPTKVLATNEKGFWTDLAKVEMGGGAFLPATEETYTACPVCKTPIAYCPKCRKVTSSKLSRHWVGIGRSKSGYQYSTYCSLCGKKTSGPSCFVATQVFGTTLDANLLTLYHLRDNCLAHSRVGPVLSGRITRLVLGWLRIARLTQRANVSSACSSDALSAFIGID